MVKDFLKGRKGIETLVLCEVREQRAGFQRVSTHLYKALTATFSHRPLENTDC